MIEKKRLIFLHGFLGSPQDWDEVIAHLPGYNCTALTYPFNIPPDGILIGYSMGGRIALRYPHRKIVISAHPGLQTDDEKAARCLHDQKWIDLLHTVAFPEFLKKWHDQPLFDSLRVHPNFPKILARRLEQQEIAREMFFKESLADQPFSTDAMFIHGQLDTKFAQLYKNLKINSLEVPHAGHAVHLEDPQGCAAAIKCNLLF